MSQKNNDVQFLASKYLVMKSLLRKTLQGARDIMAEWINENMYVRKNLRRLFQRKAVVTSKVVKAKKMKKMLRSSPSILNGKKTSAECLLTDFCMLRAEAEGFVKINVGIDKESD
jgi:uncharacterized protein